MLRTTASAARRLHTSAVRSSAFADFPLPKDVPLVAPAPVAGVAQTQSGLRAGAIDNHGPTSSLVLVVPAGARAESLDSLGVSHFLANYAYKYTSTQTPLRLAREIELRGMQVRTTTTREFLVYEAEFLRDDLSFALETLADVVYNTKYNHWEFDAVKALTVEQAAAASANAQLAGFELAHRLAFRQGLGNSVVAPQFHSINNAKVAQFAKANLAIGQGAAVFGVGVNPEELESLANVHFAAASGNAAAKQASQYFGGESRIDLPKGHNVTLAFPGAAAGSADAATLSVLTTLLGDGTKYVKWGTEAGSPLTQIGRNAHAGVKAFHASYSDAGLFGISSTCKTSAANATNGIKQAVAQLKKVGEGQVEAAEVARAVNQAKAAYLMAAEKRAVAARASAAELAVRGNVASAKDVVAAIEKVSAQELQKAAQKVLKAKPTLAVAGKSAELPYVDTLGL
ncbi:Metalloenzyme, LuxS/M16 peptidase-like protein [Catenaria anguillulae PL171]|uniref:Cytochrome b-c1 complex subunit 2, mitochondrial n=1 Tax=Catenaria anguillulae PL171 TaxID=765915 RepID=A0A1Y2HS89_9FUNG|nr:Metalloenzyme, LuxS/M16 peptidase-like protein [Catenaria anguillulae PL171]